MVTMTRNVIEIDKVNGVNVLTDSVRKRRQEYQDSKMHICAARTQLFTESWKENDGQPTVIRAAKAFQKVMEEVPIAIWDGELIVGSQTRYVRGASPLLEWYGETLSHSLNADFHHGYRATGVEIKEEDARSLQQDMEYWKDKSVFHACREILHKIMGDLAEDYDEARITSKPEAQPVAGMDVDYEAVLNRGLNGFIDEARQELARLKSCSATDQINKMLFLEAVIIALEAAIRYGKRHAELARELAQKENDVARKQELERIAEICEWVPANPARTFHEGLQAAQFMLLGIYLGGHATAETVGRLDQYLFPLYENDVKQGRLSRQEAAELLGCFWIKLLEKENIKDQYRLERSQGSQYVHVTIGGVREDGQDATNELTWLILEVARQLKVHQPHLTLRYHDSMNEDFLIKALETSRDIGAGIPQWVNDRIDITRMLSLGVPLRDARNNIAFGCSHATTPGGGTPTQGISINGTKVLELALNDGIDPRTGKRLGLPTGDPRNFNSFDELYGAFKKQFAYVMENSAKRIRVKAVVRSEKQPLPFLSALTTFGIKEARDVSDLRGGGSRLHRLATRVLDRGHVNIADSLVAIKKLVYEEKKVSMTDLLDAMAANFQGREDLRRMLLAAPKWGNDNDEADQMMKDVFTWTAKAVASETNPWGYPFTCDGRHGTAYHIWAGKTVGAMPDGRLAWTHLADGGVSPMTGMDTKGPTAICNSIVKLDLSLAGSNVLNLKFSPGSLRTRAGLNKLLSLFRSYFERGGRHIQINVLDRAMLLDAKKHPEQYRDLIVRVAGYSARFVDLDTELQDEIINRTEQGL